VYRLLRHEEKLRQGLAQDSTIQLVDELLVAALDARASDIHLQPYERHLVVRYRIDGVLYDQRTLDYAQAALVISRLKILSNLDIAQRRLPQDGRLKVAVAGPGGSDVVIDFRLSTFPTLYGEKMVVRILDRSLRLLSLDSLGLAPTMLEQLRSIINRPHGLLVVTGPTGCGKTTMLYALISALDASRKNIVTIEDPVEYELAGITQSQVNEKAGFTFENGLRAMLRQDPDIVMIGEIRDKATANIAIEAALTGHLVLSTLHTNDAPSAITRLIEMGIEPFLVSATLIGVLAQRLVRRLCPTCKKVKPLSKEMVLFAQQQGIACSESSAPIGCAKCHALGYKGRVGLFEYLMVSDAIRESIGLQKEATRLRSIALQAGMQPLVCDGLEKVKAGMTSLEEVLSVVVHD
jgi:type II secretory ATPase GspE/PulE/Tfp pilus assembly ATPase PilB-like protein